MNIADCVEDAVILMLAQLIVSRFSIGSAVMEIGIGLSGAKLTFGAFSVQGMVLATLVAIIMSLLFKLFAKLNLLNE